MSFTDECLTAQQYLVENAAEQLGYEPDVSLLDAWTCHRFYDELASEHEADHALEDGTPLYYRRDLDRAWKAVEDLARELGR